MKRERRTEVEREDQLLLHTHTHDIGDQDPREERLDVAIATYVNGGNLLIISVTTMAPST